MNKYYEHRKEVADMVNTAIVPQFEKIFSGERRTPASLHAYVMGFMWGNQFPLLRDNTSTPTEIVYIDAILRSSADINTIEDRFAIALANITEETLDEQIERLR